MNNINNLFAKKPKVINIGIKSFAESASKFTEVSEVNWNPPAWGDNKLADEIADLMEDSTPESLGSRIKEANEKAFNRLVGSKPILVDMDPAIEALPGMTKNTILHAGAPVDWENISGPMKGSIIGALIYEGRADNREEAEKLAGSGKIEFAPCHSKNAVGPMAGIISPSMPVWVVRNDDFGNFGYATMNEGWGKTLRFGAYNENVIERLHWMEETLAKAMKIVIDRLGGINLKSIIANAVQMGDECHNRDIAATNLFFKKIIPELVKSQFPTDKTEEVITFLGKHDHFFLNLGMAASKAGLVAAHNIPYSTMVTAIARNGVEVGIKVSGMEDEWFTEEAPIPEGLYFPGYSKKDANRDLGDSAIMETGGLGAFAMGAAPAIVQFVGGTTKDAEKYTKEMFKITLGKNSNYGMPTMGFKGTPTGIDIIKVVDKNILPIVNTGIAHKEPGHGLVGAGVSRMPKGCFLEAVDEFIDEYKG